MSAVPHAGMPPLDESGPALSRFEFWPMWRFYLPVMPYVGWLMLRHRGITLPGIVNPAFPEDGMAGESKSGILAAAERAAPEWTARTAPWINDGQVEAAAAAIDEAALGWPVVAKPDLGCRGAGVRRLHDHADLADYIADFPAGETIIFQQYIAHEGEAGIFYIRRPNAKTGRIPSITLKYFPWVEGDGRRTLRQLIMDDERAGEVPHLYLDRHQDRLDEVIPAGEAVRLAFAGSHSRGAIFRDGSHLATDAMCATFDEISHALGGFHFGRFDIRFADFEDVRNGHGFTILEVNGAGAEATHIWDARARLGDAYRSLREQYRLLFEIGAANRRAGVRPPSLRSMWRAMRREADLTTAYPPTE